MLHAIIADDEPKVCTLIQQLGQWERLGIEIVAVCYEGDEALAKIKELNPDIVITDIRMPVYDGLELMRLTRDFGSDAAFVIISGYRQFEYAQNAIQYGVVSYLLKPIDAEQLNAALKKICDERNMRQREQAYHTKIQNALRDRGVHEFFDLLLSGRFVPEALLHYREEYGLILGEGYCRALVINTNKPELHQPDSGFGKHVIECVSRIFPFCTEILSSVRPEGIMIILITEAQRQQEIEKGISELYSHVWALRDFFGEFDLVMGLGKLEDAPEKLNVTMQSALENEQGKFLYGWNRILERRDDLQTYYDTVSPPFSSDRTKALSAALDLCNIEEIEKWFQQWLEDLDAQSRPMLSLLLAQRNWLMKKLEDFDREKAEVLSTQVDRVRTSRDLIKILAQAYVDIAEQEIQRRDQEESRPIRLAKDYIRNHYAKALTLQEVAAQVGFSETYFSTLFKKLTNQNFTDFLVEVRIEAAKTKLRESNATISEIAEAVGYADGKYFRKIFKKIAGIKPNDYRKLYG